jgi:hypothetical protein
MKLAGALPPSLCAHHERPVAATPPTSVMNPRGASLDHLVCAAEQHRRHRNAEGLGSVEIDDQLVPDRILNGKLAWFFAFKGSGQHKWPLLHTAG